MKKKYEILLPKLKNVASTDADILLNIDIKSTFSEFKREKYDNDFDLALQFQKERDSSKNFIIYGEISSTSVHCDNIVIQLFKDSGYTTSIGSVITSPIAYQSPNVFGKRNGKYFVKLDQYDADDIYFLIPSDGSNYKDQVWSNKLMFYDTEENFVSYGTETIDVNSNGRTLEINNNFPFFFNKHWIRNNYSIKSELTREVSFNTGYTQMLEGQSSVISVALNEESAFGFESCLVDIEDLSDSISYINSQPFDPLDGRTVLDASSLYPQFSGYSIFFITIPTEYDNSLVESGSEIKIINGDYIGGYTIIDRFNPDSNLPNKFGILIDCQFNESYNNTSSYKIRPKNQNDIIFENNGNIVDFPLALNWGVGEVAKNISFTARTDFEVEFTENFKLSILEAENLNYGNNRTSEISIINETEKRYVNLNFGNIYQNRHWFTGRTVGSTNIEGLSILRNGLYYENRNEEFYPCDEFVIKIKNNGIRTLIPENEALSIESPIRFEPQQEFETTIKPEYNLQDLHEIDVSFSGIPQEIGINTSGYTSSEAFYFIDGTKINATLNQSGYFAFKSVFEQGLDPYTQASLVPPFSMTFDDQRMVVNIKSKTPATRLDFSTNDPRVSFVTKTDYAFAQQLPFQIRLLANSNQNTQANYEITISKRSFKDLPINVELNAPNEEQDYFLALCLSDALVPYYRDLDAPYHFSASTIDNDLLVAYVLSNQQSFMPKEVVLVNGVYLLSSGIMPMSRENLTNYGNNPAYSTPLSGLSNSFSAQFLPSALDIIDETYVEAVDVQTKKVIELEIPSIAIGVNPDLSQERVIEFQIGEIGNQTIYKFGGLLTEQNVLSRADSWWNNPIRIRDGNYINLFPYISMKERLDAGNNNVPEGLLSGKVKEQFPDTLIITSKLSQTPFVPIIESDIAQNSQGLTNEYINIRVMADQLLSGQVNLGNNRLGGFCFDI